MKKGKLFLFGFAIYPMLLTTPTTTNLNNSQIPIQLDSKPIESIKADKVIPMGTLIDAMILVESHGNDSAIGDTHLGSEHAVGALQIRPIMVREVNRILKLKGEKYRFKLKDRLSREKSIQMFLIWKEFHHNDADFEAIARSWNGGSKGPNNPKTYNYWKKVEQQLKNSQ